MREALVAKEGGGLPGAASAVVLIVSQCGWAPLTSIWLLVIRRPLTGVSAADGRSETKDCSVARKPPPRRK